MAKEKTVASVSRRSFLATTGGLIATAPAVGRGLALAAGETPLPRPATPPAPKPSRKIPIGVFTNVYCGLMDERKFSMDEMIDRISAIGIEALEIGTGGADRPDYCPIEELLADPAKAQAWKKKFTDRNIQVGALGAHGNPLHPDQKIAAESDKRHRNAILLAERLDVPVIVVMSGLPAGGPDDKVPNWIMSGYQERQYEWQWNEKAIPYWKELAKFAREHGGPKLAIEIHAGQIVYNPNTLLRLREAAGEEIGANIDLSHIFWQGVDAVEVIHFLGSHGATFHAHMKDTYLVKDVIARTGVVVHPAGLRSPAKGVECSYFFRTVGYGHCAQEWKNIVKAYMDTGFPGMLSIEMEDSFLPGTVGVERSFYVLKNVRDELLGQSA